MKLVAWTLAACAVMLGSKVLADPPAGGAVYRSFDSGARSVDRGSSTGIVDRVDYTGGWIDVRTAQGVERVTVLPSTIVYSRDRYATFADVRKGASVTIDLSEIGGRLIAQIIHIK